MIIDSHTHVGVIQFEVGKNRVKNLPEEDLILALRKYKIDFALVSGLEGAEYDSDFRLVPGEKQVSQKDGIERLLSFVKKHDSKLKALIWIKPYTEGFTKELEEMVTSNIKFIAGLKIHPTLSGMKVTDRRYYPYLEMAATLNLPVQVHTENDGRSDVKFVGKIASIFPGLKFVMVHMGMNTDNNEAIKLITGLENIFGDTCVVSHENVIAAIKECGSEKILFGSDAVVNGIDTYEEYLPLIEKIRSVFSENEASDVLGLNCMRIFNLPFNLK
jgi:predicted TIM-barrel fold metal-dependent hydrolase